MISQRAALKRNYESCLLSLPQKSTKQQCSGQKRSQSTWESQKLKALANIETADFNFNSPSPFGSKNKTKSQLTSTQIVQCLWVQSMKCQSRLSSQKLKAHMDQNVGGHTEGVHLELGPSYSFEVSSGERYW